MLVQRISPKVRPYVFAALLCLGTSPLFAKKQNDSFVKQTTTEETRTEIQKSDDNRYIKYLFRAIEWIPLVGLLGVMKFANHVEKKESEEDNQNAENYVK